MPARKSSKPAKKIATIRHTSDKRKNIPTAEHHPRILAYMENHGLGGSDSQEKGLSQQQVKG